MQTGFSEENERLGGRAELADGLADGGGAHFGAIWRERHSAHGSEEWERVEFLNPVKAWPPEGGDDMEHEVAIVPAVVVGHEYDGCFRNGSRGLPIDGSKPGPHRVADHLGDEKAGEALGLAHFCGRFWPLRGRAGISST